MCARAPFAHGAIYNGPRGSPPRVRVVRICMYQRCVCQHNFLCQYTQRPKAFFGPRRNSPERVAHASARYSVCVCVCVCVCIDAARPSLPAHPRQLFPQPGRTNFSFFLPWTLGARDADDERDETNCFARVYQLISMFSFAFIFFLLFIEERYFVGFMIDVKMLFKHVYLLILIAFFVRYRSNKRKKGTLM